MAMEARGASRLLNPLVFHLEKLGLELKCPICLSLMNKPILLPCNHIFCNACVPKLHQFRNECPACQHHFKDQELRPASHMENITAIYKSLRATFNSNVLPLFSSAVATDPGMLVSLSTSIEQLRKNPINAETKRENELTHNPTVNSVEGQIELTKKTGNIDVLNDAQNKEFARQREYVMAMEIVPQKHPSDLCPTNEDVKNFPVSEESDVNQAPKLSPGSSPSSGHDNAVHDNNQGCKAESGETRMSERSVRSGAYTASGREDHMIYPEPKRQKKLNYEFSEPVIRKRVSISNRTAISNPNKSHRSKDKMSVTPSMEICSASDVNANICTFCHSSIITENTGPMVHYANGKEVTRDETTFSRAIAVHRACIDWSPQVYYSNDRIRNLESELARASKLKCTSCGLKGAALGCYAKSCRRTYHVPCAMKISECRWDCDNFLMLCPVHKSIRFPKLKFDSENQDSECDHPLTTQKASEPLNFWATSHNGTQEWVFCGSALSSEEKCLTVKFGEICGATVYKFWDPSVTHVIAATDANGACSRTLKVLMAILNGKWVLTIDWVRACVEANSPVNEEPYEVNLDNHGFRDGPRTGRLGASSNAPKLFNGLSFYFSGDFVPAYKSDLLDLVTAGGGTIIEKIESIVEATQGQNPVATSFVVYNRDHPQGCVSGEAHSLVLKRLVDAKDVAKCINAQVIPHTWILESIAACTMLPHPVS